MGKNKKVGTFKYLGFTITVDARCNTEIKKTITLSEDTINKMKSIFTNINIRIYTKINTLRAYIWSTLLHGCECWTLIKIPIKNTRSSRNVVHQKNNENIMD